MNFTYDKDKIKESLTLKQIEELLNEFDAAPEIRNGVIVARTVCHGGDHHKLYYYNNTKLFKCYTDCIESTFDVFELVRKVMSREHPKAPGQEWSLPQAIEYVAMKFRFSANQEFEEHLDIEDDLKIFQNYDRINNIDINTQEVELQSYDGEFLQNLPRPKIEPWLNEGISQEVMDNANICYDPKNCGIVIPHYDINNRLVGVRERTLIQEQAEQYGKYMPAKIAGKMYNHPLSFNLYNLNKSKDNIKRIKKAIVFESEKSTLQFQSFFGQEHDISCAACGSNFISYHFWLLSSIGAEEIIIGFDRQFKKIGDEEYKRWVKKLKQISKKYSKYCNITFLFDTKNLLGYKDSPTDRGKEIFLQLFKERLDSEGKER